MRKLGNISLAILNCLADRAGVLLEQILAGRNQGLQESLNKINALPTIDAYYYALRDAQKGSLKTAIWRLQEKGLVAKGAKGPKLTELGTAFLEKLHHKHQKPKWDGRWRIVFFDIPEKMKAKRRWFNHQLRGAGFRPLQKSVFIGQYAISESLFREIEEVKIRNFIRIITVGEIDDETILEA